VSFVNRTDLGREDEPTGLGPVICKSLENGGDVNFLELEKSGLGGLQVFAQLPEPTGMGEVAGADDIDPFYSTPGSQTGQVAQFARCPGKG